jgi:hypothetical protein
MTLGRARNLMLKIANGSPVPQLAASNVVPLDNDLFSQAELPDPDAVVLNADLLDPGKFLIARGYDEGLRDAVLWLVDNHGNFKPEFFAAEMRRELVTDRHNWL